MNILLEHLRMTRPLVRDTMWNNLMADLRDHKQINPLLVRKVRDDIFDVIDGNKRLGAAFALGWEKIQCEVVA